MTPTICTITHVLGTSTVDALPDGDATVTDRDYDGTVLCVRTFGTIAAALRDATDLALSAWRDFSAEEAADLGSGECHVCGGTKIHRDGCEEIG